MGAVSALTTTLKDGSADVRFMAAWALGMMGPSAREALGDLRDALKDEDLAVRATAEEAMHRIEDE
jgi:HEAT repeat protein